MKESLFDVVMEAASTIIADAGRPRQPSGPHPRLADRAAVVRPESAKFVSEPRGIRMLPADRVRAVKPGEETGSKSRKAAMKAIAADLIAAARASKSKRISVVAVIAKKAGRPRRAEGRAS